MSSITKYRSRFTGAEIDTLLASISNKIDATIIVNDWSGGTSKVASAELAKILYADMQSFKDPNYLLNLIQTIPDFNIFTTAEKTKLESMSAEFKGTFSTKTDRDNNLTTTSYVGGETCIVLNVGSGLGEIETWDYSTSSWATVELYDVGNIATISMASTTTQVYTIDTDLYSTVKLLISAQKVIAGTNNIQTIEITANSNGTDVWYSTSSNLGNNSSLVNVVVSYSYPSIVISVTGSTGTTIGGRPLAVF